MIGIYRTDLFMRFKYIFFFAQLNEIIGRFGSAAAIMDKSIVPSRLQSLKETYSLRLRVLDADPEDGLRVIRSMQFGSWINDRRSPDDEYAANYVEYMLAGVQGDVLSRKNIARKLRNLDASDIYKSALKITDE